jgi:hypothetical protein
MKPHRLLRELAGSRVVWIVAAVLTVSLASAHIDSQWALVRVGQSYASLPADHLPGTAGSKSLAAAERTVEGILQYVPAPDVTICFCGSFFVTTEKDEVIYLAAEGIDLLELVHKKVSVTGTPYVTGCIGTLYQPCTFVLVGSIKLVTPLPTERSTWGAIKSLFD